METMSEQLLISSLDYIRPLINQTMSETNKGNLKKGSTVPTPGIIGNIDSIVGNDQIKFKTLIGSMTLHDSPRPQQPKEEGNWVFPVPWVSGLSMHYWLVEKCKEECKVKCQCSKDSQNPHFQDEIYFVLEGNGKIMIGDDTIDIKKGDVIFVPAYKKHRFLRPQFSDLRMLIFFGPDYCGRDASKH